MTKHNQPFDLRDTAGTTHVSSVSAGTYGLLEANPKAEPKRLLAVRIRYPCFTNKKVWQMDRLLLRTHTENSEHD